MAAKNGQTETTRKLLTSEERILSHIVKDRDGTVLNVGDHVRCLILGSPRAYISGIDHHLTNMVILSRPIDGYVDWHGDQVVKIPE